MKVPTSKPTLASGKTKFSSKKKARKEKACTSTEDSDDVSVSGNSFPTSVHGVRELVKAVSVGTREFQDLLLDECSLIYECRVCRNLFRSVANFIAHKRSYCKERYHYFNHGFFNDQLQSTSQVEQSMRVEPEPPPANESTEVDWFNELNKVIPRSRRKNSFPQMTSALLRSPPMKLLGRNLWPDREKGMPVRRVPNPASNELPVVCKLEGVRQTREAVFQTVSTDSASTTPTILQELEDLHSTLQVKGAVILEDGHVAKPDGSHSCEKCDASFPTARTLERHFTVYHSPRTCYPCPICKVFLASPWGVYRHLSKLHHKSEEQIRRLRPQVLSKATKRELYQATRPTSEVPAAVDIAKLDAREEEKWIAQFEGELHCTICGKSFSRRAALTVHSAKCKVYVPKPAKPEVPPEPTGPQICEKCGREFARKAVLVVHAQTCNGSLIDQPVRAHPCIYCSRTFSRRRTLTVHLLKCQQVSKMSARSPLSLLLTPPKPPALSAVVSPSSIQVRRDYCKPSLTIAPRCSCPELCAIHQSLSNRLETVVKKLQGMPTTNETKEQSTSSSENKDLVEDITTVSSDVNSVDKNQISNLVVIPSPNVSSDIVAPAKKASEEDNIEQSEDRGKDIDTAREVLEKVLFEVDALHYIVDETSAIIGEVGNSDESDSGRDTDLNLDSQTPIPILISSPSTTSSVLEPTPSPQLDTTVSEVIDLTEESSPALDCDEASQSVHVTPIPSREVESDEITLTFSSFDMEPLSEPLPVASTCVIVNGDDSGVPDDCNLLESEIENSFEGFDLTDLILDSVLNRMQSVVESHEKDLVAWTSKDIGNRPRFANGAETRRPESQAAEKSGTDGRMQLL